MARILIVGGGCPGRALAARLVDQRHAVRMTTRHEQRRAEIEQSGAECWIGTPDRLATMRGALENVTIACWMLAAARGTAEQLQALHGARLEFFLSQAIDTTVRGFLYDATPGVVPDGLLSEGASVVARMTELNAIPAVVLGGTELARGGDRAAPSAGADPRDADAWVDSALAGVEQLLSGSS